MPRSFVEALMAARWDLVHSELLSGYPVTLEALKTLRESSGGLEDRALRALLSMLAWPGDTLIASKRGFAAMKRSILEARAALLLSGSWGVRRALEWLDSEWRDRGWNPGAVLDVLAAAIGLYLLEAALGSSGQAVGGF